MLLWCIDYGILLQYSAHCDNVNLVDMPGKFKQDFGELKFKFNLKIDPLSFFY